LNVPFSYGNEYELDPECPAKGHWGTVLCVAFSNDKKTLASASSDKTVKLWEVSGDTPKFKTTLTGYKEKVTSVAFSHDNKILASASADGTVKLCCCGTCRETRLRRRAP